MSDPEWKDIKASARKLHGTFVNSIEEKILILTDYSPQKFLTQRKPLNNTTHRTVSSHYNRQYCDLSKLTDQNTGFNLILPGNTCVS